jgi:septal ring factor EnvC (AmiA/AmiB activator)
MTTRQLFTASIVFSLLLTAPVVCGQRTDASGNNGFTELRQELARSRAELESRKRDNQRLAEQRKILEAEIASLREKLLEQDRSAEAALQNGGSVVEQRQPAAK